MGCCFLVNIMKGLGLLEKWVNWVEQWATITSLSILINGNPHSLIHPLRDLDKAIPYHHSFFMLGAKILARMLKR